MQTLLSQILIYSVIFWTELFLPLVSQEKMSLDNKQKYDCFWPYTCMFIKNSKSLIHKRVYFPATLDDLFGDADDISSDEEDKKGEGEREEGDEDKPQVGFYPINIWLVHRVLLFSSHLLMGLSYMSWSYPVFEILTHLLMGTCHMS